jgi:hypothetical protein
LKKRCRDCAFFSLASEGLDLDRCRFFNRPLSREETMVKTQCTEFIKREDEKDVEFYIPNRADKKETYEREIRKYSIYMILLVILGIGFFYLVTTAT